MSGADLWSALCHSSPDGLLELTTEGRVIRANPTFLGWIGLSLGALQGRLLTEYLRGDVGFPLTVPVWAGFVRVEGPSASRLISLTLTAVTPWQERVATVVGVARMAPDVLPLRETIRRTLDELDTTQLVTANTLARMAEYHSPDTAGHLDRVRLYTYALATSYGGGACFTEPEVIELSRCAVLHDVGKVAVPEALLTKVAPLSPAQQAVVESHTLIGERILAAADAELKQLLGAPATFLGTARAVARHHHERWDGQGYPDRLRGEQIPLAARIVAVADVYDELTRGPATNVTLLHAKAHAQIMAESGRRFDPQVVAAFAAVADLFCSLLHSVFHEPVTTDTEAR